MSFEEARFFNLARAYAEPKYPFVLTELKPGGTSSPRTLIFKDPQASGSTVPRQVTVFEDQFRETLDTNELSSAIRQNIDEALRDKWLVASKLADEVDRP